MRLSNVLIALFLSVSTARAMTLAAGSAAPARWATGRVLSAVPDPASRTTLVTLGDGAGNEIARFTTLGAVDGRVRWVVDGMPIFQVGDEVEVGLTAEATLALDDEGNARAQKVLTGLIGSGLAGLFAARRRKRDKVTG